MNIESPLKKKTQSPLGIGKRSLYEFYNSIFEGVLADTDELKEECYRLRYQIYCMEFGYLDPNANPHNLECDEDDPYSLHALLRHRESGAFTGTVRLIRQRPGSQTGTFPVHRLCKENNLVMPELVPLQNMAEISRFCILKDFRRRIIDTIASSSYSLQELEVDKARVIPSMSLGLIRMIVVMAKQNGIQQWCAEMEPFLIRLLAKLGINFDPVGPLIEFHGMRQICYRRVDEWLAQIFSERPDVWEVITERGLYS